MPTYEDGMIEDARFIDRAKATLKGPGVCDSWLPVNGGVVLSLGMAHDERGDVRIVQADLLVEGVLSNLCWTASRSASEAMADACTYAMFGHKVERHGDGFSIRSQEQALANLYEAEDKL